EVEAQTQAGAATHGRQAGPETAGSARCRCGGTYAHGHAGTGSATRAADRHRALALGAAAGGVAGSIWRGDALKRARRKRLSCSRAPPSPNRNRLSPASVGGGEERGTSPGPPP